MKIQLLSAIFLSSLSLQAVAVNEYWLGTDGGYVRDRNGHCVRTINWTPAAAIPGCEGGEVTANTASTASPVMAAASEEPVAESKADTANEGASETLSLASGATFELGGSTLSAEGKAEIAALITQFDGKTVDSVVIEGHTDDSGDAAFNQQLSEKRAEAVKAELVANGANAEKISTVGYGESKPIADNTTRDGRAKNRRVEIKVDGVKNKV